MIYSYNSFLPVRESGEGVNCIKNGAGCFFCRLFCLIESCAVSNIKLKTGAACKTILPFIKLEKIFLTPLFLLKPFTVLTLTLKQVLHQNQLLQNKWYYVLHSTK
jgi:hypothetical protein